MKKIFLSLIGALLLLPLYNYAQGCMDTNTEEGVQVIGYIQPEFRYDFLGEDIQGESLNEASYYFNRVRFGATGSSPYDFSYYAVAELSPTLGGPFILDAFISYNRFAPYATVSFGQFRSPFGLELGNTGCHKLHTINRSLAVSQLAGPFRDMGFMFSGGTGDLSVLGSKTENFFSYKLALLNGTGKNTFDDNRKKDFVGRFAVHPFEFITVGASYRMGKHPAKLEDAEDDERSRWGVDLELKYKGFLLQGEYISAADVGSYTIGGGCGDPLQIIEGSVDRQGFFVQAMYMTPWRIQPVIKFEQYDPNIAGESIDDIQNTVTYGLNYFFNDKTRFQLNYLYNAEESGRVEVENDALLFQFQILF